ncbi:prolyl hydroxylase family protein [Alteromonas oceanisediminis]|uniref:prolyl hydroxylase family protein n=1 Tax=Alteromonas oceanisediminis TaxID=2836180 RepID=UPI001BDA278F|nr:2OG-Fe(II) oxygenase [Alteromonas oceanisediminis]MBT0584862.1 2OG-Fe(II) oxygenase [Alteromonas oceanisediminis]
MTGESLFQQALDCFGQRNTQGAIGHLEQAAELGHLEATLFLAEQYFRNDPESAFDFLRRQSEAGVVGALHRLVTLQVFFHRGELRLEDVVDLHHEVIHGHVESMAIMLDIMWQLPLYPVYANYLLDAAPDLAAEFAVAGAAENGDADLEPLFKDAVASFNQRFSKKPNMMCDDERIVIYSQAVSPVACSYITQALSKHLAPSRVLDPVSGESIQHSVRTSDVVLVTPDLINWFILYLDKLTESLAGVSAARGEPFSLLRYVEGQEYKPHYDAIIGEGPQFKTFLQDGGQRVKTAIYYLSDQYEGGETIFPKRKLRLKASKGDILVFDNLAHDGSVLRDSYHAGNPVTAGSKWVLTKWIRESTTHYGDVVYPNRG